MFILFYIVYLSVLQKLFLVVTHGYTWLYIVSTKNVHGVQEGSTCFFCYLRTDI